MSNSPLNKLRQMSTLVRELGMGPSLTCLKHRPLLRSGLKKPPVLLRTKLALHPLFCRPGTSDFDAFNLIFLKREFRCLGEVTDPSLIVDCGANVGYASAFFLSRFPGSTVIAVEPDPGNFTLLRRNLAPYGPRAQVRQAAIWSHPTRLVLSSDAFRDNREWSRQVRPARDHEIATVVGIDLGTLLRESGRPRIDLLKVDIEGSEAELFSGHLESWLHAVATLAIELHDDRCREIFRRALQGGNMHCAVRGEWTICRRHGFLGGTGKPARS